MLGLAHNNTTISHKMITTSEELLGFEIVEMMGPIEGVVEVGYAKGFGVVEGGKLEEMLFVAKDILARSAYNRSADGVIGFRYMFTARELEKSVVAYGTAVKCKKRSTQEQSR
jgi:uncharacterized protein YbjQ (UPF0145 family)